MMQLKVQENCENFLFLGEMSVLKYKSDGDSGRTCAGSGLA